MDAFTELRSLPRPTEEQYQAFALHVGEAHSWYKHLPLLTGGQFVVFLAPDSGVGRLVARLEGAGYHLVTPPEGPVFTEAHPRLHYSWKTSEEYRHRFGFLDYAYRTHPESTFGRDVGGPMSLPEEIWQRCSFTLFPYVAGGDPGREAVRWAHLEAVEQLRSGASHPRHEAVLEWARLAGDLEVAWQGLTSEEREVVMAVEFEGAQTGNATPAVDRYFAIEAELEAVYESQLRAGELRKIQKSLDDLRAWYEGR